VKSIFIIAFENKMKRFVIILILFFGFPSARLQSLSISTELSSVKYVIVFICDGCGANQLEVANIYTGFSPSYQDWTNYWMSTYPSGGSYEPVNAWSSFDYVKTNPTDSAGAATAMFSGIKTANGRINVSENGALRLLHICEDSRSLGYGTGAVTTVQVSHATPGAWLAHNDSRANGYAIADEAIWGNPNTTGSPIDAYYGGGHGTTLPATDVLIGGGHPDWDNSHYINQAILDKLISENSQPGSFVFVQRIAGSPDGGTRLLNAANTSATMRLMGLFGGTDGNFEFRQADGLGYNPENPTLAQATQAALKVLERNEHGFILLIEGGAPDKAAHSNNMDQLVGEIIDFNQAIESAIDWIEDPNNTSNWQNTLVIVTSDHETGYLTATPGQFPNEPIIEVSNRTLSLEKKYLPENQYRASWEDTDGDNYIDLNEPVYWAWNSTGHTNSLIRLFVKGLGETEFFRYAVRRDSVRGLFIDNTDIYRVLYQVIHGFTPRTIHNLPLPLIAR
jgi:alkaline phosphatase